MAFHLALIGAIASIFLLSGCGCGAGKPAASPSPAQVAPIASAGNEKTPASRPAGGGASTNATGGGASGGVGPPGRGRFANDRESPDPSQPRTYEPGPGGRPAKLDFRPDLPKYVEKYPGYEQAVDVRKTVESSSASVARGRRLYEKSCQVCHGPDGAGPEKGPTNSNVAPRNLANPIEYKYGASDQAIWRSIKYGIPGGPMGGFDKSYTEEQVWDLVNFLQSLEKPQL